jgi:membrane protease YdiL (CAAX protease family)
MFLETIKSLCKFIILFTIYVLTQGITNNFNNIYLSLLIPAFFIILVSIIINFKELKKSLKNIKKDIKPKLFILGLILCIISIILNIILTKLTGHTSINQSTLIENIHKYKYLYSFIIIFITPFEEELLFRLPYSNSKNILSFIISSLIFVTLHLSNTSDLIFLIAYLLPTLGLTLNYFKTNNIYISYILHVLNNLINVLLLIWWWYEKEKNWIYIWN